MFSHTAKWPSHIKYAKQAGVQKTTFDSVEELMKIHSHFPEAHLLLRIRTPVHSVLQGRERSIKFGADMENVPALLQHIKRLNLSLIGVSFHVGPRAPSSHPYTISIKNARKIYDLSLAEGFNLKYLDIGGGFTAGNGFPEIAAEINQALDKHFPNESFPNLTIISEPGRFFSASPFYLATHVILSQIRNSTTHLYLSDGIYGSFRFKALLSSRTSLNWGQSQVPFILGNSHNFQNRKMRVTQLWGPTCDSSDVTLTLMLPETHTGE